MSKFIFGSLNTDSYGVKISGTRTFDKPKRAGSHIAIPGKNGSVFIPENRYENVQIAYDCYMKEWEQWESFADALYSETDEYRRLEDTYHPDCFRMVLFTDATKPETGTANRNGKFTVSFNCKPQMFLKSGERRIQLNNHAVLINPTRQEALPIIRVYGKGELTIGNSHIIVSKAGTAYIDIDTETENAFEGSDNRNSCIASESVYGTLTAGSNTLEFSGFSKVEVIPRWWTV